MRKEKIGQISKNEALKKAAYLCSASEHCTTQIYEKLQVWGVSEEDANDILIKLTEEGFIDNVRFCRAYCHDKILYSRWGKVKITQMLCRLRLSNEEITEGISTIQEKDYLEALNSALRLKDRTLKDTNMYQCKGKLVRHLLSRGFEMELVVDAVNSYFQGR